MANFIGCDYLIKNCFLSENRLHKSTHIFYLLDGELSYSIKGKEINVKKGDFFHFPSNVLCEKRKIHKVVTWYHIWFECMDSVDFPEGKIFVKDTNRMLCTFKYIIDLDKSSEDTTYLKNHFVDDIIVQIQADNILFNRENNSFLQEIDGFLNENISKKILLSDISKKFGLSSGSVINYFNKYLNTTPIKYITVQRIKKAELLLCHTDFPMRQIASECGFENEYYFSNTFKKYNALSPTLYREKYKV